MSKSRRSDQQDSPMDRQRSEKRNQQQSAEVNRNEERITANSQNSGKDQWNDAGRKGDADLTNQSSRKQMSGSDKRDQNARQERGNLRDSSRSSNYTGHSERTGQQYSDPQTESNPESKDIRDKQRFHPMDPAEGSE